MAVSGSSMLRSTAPRGVCGCLRSAIVGFVKLWLVTLGLDGVSILSEIFVSVVLTIPVSVAASYWVFEGNLHWDDTLHLFMSAALGFLLVFRLQIAYQRYWEARGHLEDAIHACRQIAVLVVTQYHRHYGEPGPEVPKCVDDVRRYLMMYYLSMVYRLLDLDLRQPHIENFCTQQELLLLLRVDGARSITCVKWVGARLAHLEALGYMAPLQLHETNEGLSLMIRAYNGLVKIKTTPTPFSIRQLCSVMAVVYVYAAPLALANSFTQLLDSYWSVMLRTVFSALLLGFAILGINQTAAVLEEPWRNDESDLPMLKFALQLHKELLSLFAEPIPPLIGTEAPADESAAADTGAKPAGDGARGGRLKDINGK